MAVVAFYPYSNSISEYMYRNDNWHTQHLLSEMCANRLTSLLGIQIILSLQGRELCVTDIASCVDMSISSVSHQLKSLRLARIIKQRKEGRTVYYSLDDEHVRDILATSLEHVHHV